MPPNIVWGPACTAATRPDLEELVSPLRIGYERTAHDETDPLQTDKVIKKNDRRFYQSAKFLKGIKGPFTLTVNEFAAISTNELENPKTGDLIYGEQGDDIPDGYERLYETVQVLALFEDLKGKAAHVKMAVVRWMFHPRHLPADHSERSKARKGDAKKEVYLACDVNNTDMNKLEQILFKRTVVCNWSMSDGPEKLYRAPTPEQLRKADAIITQAWHPQKATPMVLARVVSTSDGASEGSRKEYNLAKVNPATLFAGTNAPSAGDDATSSSSSDSSSDDEPLIKAKPSRPVVSPSKPSTKSSAAAAPKPVVISPAKAQPKTKPKPTAAAPRPIPKPAPQPKVMRKVAVITSSSEDEADMFKPTSPPPPKPVAAAKPKPAAAPVPTAPKPVPAATPVKPFQAPRPAVPAAVPKPRKKVAAKPPAPSEAPRAPPPWCEATRSSLPPAPAQLFTLGRGKAGGSNSNEARVSAGAAQAAFVAASATAPPKRAADNVQPASTGVKIQRKNKNASASSAAALQKVSSKASSLVEKKLSLSGTLYGLDLRLREGPLQSLLRNLRVVFGFGGSGKGSAHFLKLCLKQYPFDEPPPRPPLNPSTGAAAVQLSITASSDGNPFDVKDDANAALIDTLSGTYFIKPTNDPRAIPRPLLLVERPEPRKFYGHTKTDELEKNTYGKGGKLKHVVTHISQPNTIEWNMSLEWRLVRNRQELETLLQKRTHAEEIKQLQEEYIKAATAANASNKGKAPM